MIAITFDITQVYLKTCFHAILWRTNSTLTLLEQRKYYEIRESAKAIYAIYIHTYLQSSVQKYPLFNFNSHYCKDTSIAYQLNRKRVLVYKLVHILKRTVQSPSWSFWRLRGTMINYKMCCSKWLVCSDFRFQK